MDRSKNLMFLSVEALKNDDHTIFYVYSPFNFSDPKVLIGVVVNIDGKNYTILGVEKRCINTVRKGTLIGLKVRE